MIKPKITTLEGFMIVSKGDELDNISEIFTDALEDSMLIKKIKTRVFPEKISLS